MPNLRLKKSFHAVAKGRQTSDAAIYTDYFKKQEAISGMSLSKHCSVETLGEAVDYMRKNGIQDPSIIVYRDGMKYRFTLDEYQKEIGVPLPEQDTMNSQVIKDLLTETLPLNEESGSPASIHSFSDPYPDVLNSIVVEDLLRETMSLTPAKDEDWESKLEETLKKCDEAVLSFHDAEKERPSFVTSTPFRSEPSGQTQDILDDNVLQNLRR